MPGSLRQLVNGALGVAQGPARASQAVRNRDCLVSLL